MSLYYFNALAGAGKTHALAQYADRIAQRGQKVLFIQPTKHLINKTIEGEFLKLDPKYRLNAIHGDEDLGGGSVIGNLVAHFQNTPPGGEVLFATHAAFMLLPFIQNRKDWVLLVDEVPQVDVFKELNLAETHHLLTPLLTLVPEGPRYGRLIQREDEQ
jgi:superfamily II DNA or RNA helicase